MRVVLAGLWLLSLAAVVTPVQPGEGLSTRHLLASHRYKKGDHVELFANKAGPFANPAETYQYYDLPFCRLGGDDSELKHKREGLGEVVDGNRQIHTPYDLPFREDKDHVILCTKDLTQKEVEKFRKAVAKNYYYNVRHPPG